MSDALLPMSLQPLPSAVHDPFCRGTYRNLAGLRLASLSVGGICAGSRSLPSVARAQAQVKVLFLTQGRSRLWQSGQACWLEAGSWIIYDPARPYRIDTESTTECLAVALPVALLPAGRGQLEDHVRVQPRDIGGNMLLAWQAMDACIQGVAQQGQDDLAAAAQAILTLLDAGVRRAVAPSASGGPTDAADSLRLRAEWLLRERCGDPGFTVDDAARLLQVSRRTLYNALKPGGQTPYRVIQQYRLEAALVALADKRLRHRSVTTIALDAGFPDAGHFARLFRQHTGMTPSAYRLQMADQRADGAAS